MRSNNKTGINRLLDSNLLMYLFFILIVYLAYYTKMRNFGLYEDDYWFAGIPANCDSREIWHFLKLNFSNFQNNQGRYIAAFLPLFLPYLNFKIGGFFMLYFFGILLVSFNAYLVFHILKLRVPGIFAMSGALFFILFPADTSKAFLTHIYQLQLSLLFTFSGMLLYLKHKRISGYILAFLSLLTYENAFLPFVLIPLFDNLKWNRKLLLQLIYHIIIVGSVFIILFMIRKLMGERIVSGLTLTDMITKTLLAMMAGPLFVVYSFLKAPLESLSNLNNTWFIMFLGLIILCLYLFMRYGKSNGIDKGAGKPKFIPDLKKGEFFTIGEYDLILKTIVTGGLMMIIAYAFSITHFPPTALKGRETSVHLGTTFGSSMVFASVIYLLFIMFRTWKYKRIVIFLTSFYLTLLIGYGRLIQNDFAKSWNIQKHFWTDVIRTCPDVKNGTLLFLKNENLEETEFIHTFSWACPLIYENLIRFPDEWKKPPKLQLIESTADTTFATEGDKILYKVRYPFLFYYQDSVELQDGNVIFLEKKGTGLKRLTGEITINGIPLHLKDPGVDKLKTLDKQNLYHYMIND